MADQPTPDTPDQSVPRPGHFLPGGEGESEAGATPRRPVTRPPLSLGKPQPVRPPVDPTLRRSAPQRSDAVQTGFGAPPAAPLPGAPSTPLTRAHQRGGARPGGWHRPSSRGVPQYGATPPDLKPPRRFPKPLIAGFAALLLIVVAGGGYGGVRLMDSYDDTVEDPLARPSVKQTEEPLPAPPRPTVTVTVQPVPDAVRVKQNGLYKAGKVPSVRCTEPKIRPSTEAAVLRYYRAMLPCLNKAWEPLVRKAGYPFRAPKLVLYTKNQSPCPGDNDGTVAFYCGEDETITMIASADLKNHRINPVAARVMMMDTLAHEYAHHVQMLTNILISSHSRKGWAKTEAAKLEESRRLELQATCLGAAFLGANRTTLGLTGSKLRIWQYKTKYSGDEYNPKKKRDHGSRKNNWAWAAPAFTTHHPTSCNTFTAPPHKVS